jgi:hypothetical protein
VQVKDKFEKDNLKAEEHHNPIPNPKLYLDHSTLFIERINHRIEGSLASFGRFL